MATPTILSGRDSISVGQTGSDFRNLVNLADGNIGHITMPNNHANMTVGKDGTAIVARDQKGRQGELVIRVLQASPDDDYLIGLLYSYINANPGGFVPIIAQITKYVSDAAGNLSTKSYVLSGGTIMKSPEFVSDVNGDLNQNVAVWTIQGVIDIVISQ